MTIQIWNRSFGVNHETKNFTLTYPHWKSSESKQLTNGNRRRTVTEYNVTICDRPYRLKLSLEEEENVRKAGQTL